MRCRVKKLFKGYASIRDYIVEECIKNGEPLEIWLDLNHMTVPTDVLKERFQLHKQQFRSLYNFHQQYGLMDFKFQADGVMK
jgi:hypothetical protein